MVTEKLIGERVPIRGQEMKFLRKALALTFDRFAKELGLTAAAVRKWELKETERLHPINEAAVRSFFAEKLEVNLARKFSELKGTKESPEELALKAS